MARLARAEVFGADEIAIVHVMNRTVRRCFLLGDDPVTGKNYDHRKQWIDDQLVHQAKYFGIDLLCQAILSNHFHLVLRSRPDVVKEWDDTEVARRWLMLCPVSRDEQRQPVEPTEFELNQLRNNKEKLAEIRRRLSDISWWMRLLGQNIAQRANTEDEEVGKFWQARYRAVRLLDETAILACAAYVDLNPIRAAMAETIEESDYTSAQKRVAACRQFSADSVQLSDNRTGTDVTGSEGGPPRAVVLPPRPSQREGDTEDIATLGTKDEVRRQSHSARHLAPVPLKSDGKTGPDVNKSGTRCSNKGFLPMSSAQYLQLLDWTARQRVKGKAGATPKHVPRLLERLGLNADQWSRLVQDFGRLFSVVAGQPHRIDGHRPKASDDQAVRQRYHARRETRELFSSASP